MTGIDIPKIQSLNQGKDRKKIDLFSVIIDIFSRDIKIFSTKFNDKKKERLYTELGILLSAKVDIKTSLELLRDQQSKDYFINFYENIIKLIIEGETLSKALDKTGNFSKYEIFSLQIGEESGKIKEVLLELSRFYKGKIKQSRQIINALSYPSIVLITAFGAVFFMMKFVVPMFSDVFKRFNSDLPALTKVIIRLSELFSQFSVYFLILILLFGIVIYLLRRTDKFRDISSAIILKMPVLGDLISKIYLARFCHSMHLLISSKTPLIKTIDLVKNMVEFYPIEKSLDFVKDGVIKGESLHFCLSKFKIYDKRLISLIKVGEEVNQLEFIFANVNEQYATEIEYKTGLISSLLEPFIIIFLGLLVAVILIAMYLPLFKLSTTIGV